MLGRERERVLLQPSRELSKRDTPVATREAEVRHLFRCVLRHSLTTRWQTATSPKEGELG